MIKIPTPSEASDYVYTNRQNLIDRYINNIFYILKQNVIPIVFTTKFQKK